MVFCKKPPPTKRSFLKKSPSGRVSWPSDTDYTPLKRKMGSACYACCCEDEEKPLIRIEIEDNRFPIVFTPQRPASSSLYIAYSPDSGCLCIKGYPKRCRVKNKEQHFCICSWTIGIDECNAIWHSCRCKTVDNSIVCKRHTRVLTAEEINEEDSTAAICSICLEDFLFQEDVVSLISCGHKYHNSCIKVWIKRRLLKPSSCPLCMRDVSSVTYNSF